MTSSAVAAEVTAKAGRTRLPPARIRWLATSVRKGSSVTTEARRASSTRPRSAWSTGS